MLRDAIAVEIDLDVRLAVFDLVHRLIAGTGRSGVVGFVIDGITGE
jgi:hypothetical protein